MKNFKTFEEILEPDYPPDAWSDDVCLLAERILEGFTPADWDALQTAWPVKSAPWQSRLADTLSSSPPERAIGILLALILSENEDVAETAALSLKGFRTRFDPAMLTIPQKEKIRTVAGKSPFTQMALEALLNTIEAV